MKRFIITGMLLCTIQAVHAQPSADRSNWEDNDRVYHQPKSTQDNPFVNTEMAEFKKVITFSDLPEVKKPIWAIVTDPQGEVMAQKRVSPASNSFDVRRLSKGELYYVTLVYRSKSKKAFVLHL